MAWKWLEKVSYAVLVDNLPTSITKSWFWQLFNYEGRVVDVFMSQKQRKTSKLPFAFVRFSQLKEAQSVIERMHGWEIKGFKLSMTMAEYGRSDV